MKRWICALASCLAADGCTTDLPVFAGEARDAGVEPAGSEDASVVPDPPLLTFGRRMMAAFEHTCVIRADGLYCWGDNAEGQLGLGDRVSRSEPVKVEGVDSAREVCVGEVHSCALLADRSLYCWGKNGHGELGTGDGAAALTPRVVPGQYQRLACGGSVTCAIDQALVLWCWGDNVEGQVRGELLPTDVFVPTRAPIDRTVTQVSVGQGHVCAISSGGRLACWGRNSEQQLGVALQADPLPTPTSVGSEFRRVSAGQKHSCGVLQNNTLVCWGSPDEGKLGIADQADLVSTPTPVTWPANDFYEVVANWFHTCVLHDAGMLACFGRNAEGQLGLGDIAQRDTPVDIGGDWDAVTVGRFHTCARREATGEISCWGANNHGQLGLGDDERRDVPEEVAFP